MTKELEINGVLDLSESAISMEEFQRKFLILCEENNISFGGVFYELDENGERKDEDEKLFNNWCKGETPEPQECPFLHKLEKENEELKAQIEKMKCGGNCRHSYYVNTGGCYDMKCRQTYCDCINCSDKWELAE